MQRSLLFDPVPEIIEPCSFEEKFTPRPYQEEAIGNSFRYFSEGHTGTLVRCFTGGGKTFMGSWVASRWIERSDDHYVMILAHERQLVNQFREEVQDLLGIPVGLEMSDDGRISFGPNAPRIIVASRATLLEDKDENSRLYKFDWNKKWLTIFDECHKYKYGLKSVRHIVDWFERNPESRRLGLTATPMRSDGVSLARLFPSVALDYKMYDLNGGPSAVNDGWAVRYDQRYITVEGVDFKNIGEVNGDFDDEELEEALLQKEALDSMIKPMIDLVGERRTIIFNAGVKAAKLVAELINAESEKAGGGPIAESLDGSVPEDIRQEVYRRHQSGDIQFLSVCGLCREGYNDPGIEAVACFRPTKSLSLAIQMKGRGCRPLRGVVDGLATKEERLAAIAASDKPDCMIIDLVGISGLPDVASTLDIMAEGKPDEVLDRAKEKSLESDGELSLEDLIREAEEELEEEKRQAQIEEDRERAREEAERRRQEEKREARRLAKLETDVRYQEHRISNGGGAPPSSRRKMFDSLSRMPFGKYQGTQISELPAAYLRWGTENFKRWPLKRAFENEIKRRENGDPLEPSGKFSGRSSGATEQQRRILGRFGFSGEYTFEEAGRIILDEINPQLNRK